ncbi:cation:proton antiporter [Aerococcaceae bacterium DSM 111022]|nr:cation:proton antiporter [Aerococcaceae bacterium DSM 111022]
MLSSIAMIVLLGIFTHVICRKINIPSLVGLIFIGILIGPSVFDWLDPTLLEISADIRQVVLIIILTRAGLSLNLNDLKKVGRPAVLLSFLPATFEIIATMFFAPIFLGLSLIESALLGAVLGAVSPAVVVPRMITLIHEKRGTNKGIPQLILAGSSVDDIYALVMFSAFLSLAQSGEFSVFSLLDIPLSIISGVLIGFLTGYFLSMLFEKVQLQAIIQVLIMLSLSFILVSMETWFINIPFSGILAVMSMSIVIYRQVPSQADQILHLYNQLWIPGEIFLFVLVGASVDIYYAFSAGFTPVIVILLALILRTIGTWLSVSGSILNTKEKIFTAIAYMPKATVQAAIGGVPLALGLPAGELILTVSVLAILITAPIGAFGIDYSYSKLLTQD